MPTSAQTLEFDSTHLFIGLTNGALKNKNAQSGEEGIFVDYIKRIFESNKAKINNGLYAGHELGSDLFDPIFYNIFGDYDYAFIARSDSFQFGAKSFRPYGLHFEGNESISVQLPFQFQCFYGPQPIIHADEQVYNQLTENKLDTFAKKNCISICQVKLNNALVIGGGKQFLQEMLQKMVGVLNKYPDLIANISLSFSWHEITLTCFADNYIDIFCAVQDIRALSLDEKIISDPDSWYKKSIYNTLNGEKCHDPIPFVKETNTKFGFRYCKETKDQNDVIKEINIANNEAYGGIKGISRIKYVTRVHAKPERIEELWSFLSDEAKVDIQLKDIRHVSGRAVLNYSLESMMSLMCSKDIVGLNCIRKISTYLEFFSFDKTKADEENSMLAMESTEQDAVVPVDENLVDNDTFFTHRGIQKEVFEVLEFDLEMIDSIKLKCNNELLFPKILTERIQRLLVNYNRNVEDPAIFTYFMELHAPIAKVCDLILNTHARREIITDIQNLLDSIEHSFRTRYYHTPQFIYSGDTSTEHSGGVLQIMGAYDCASKIISRMLYNTQDKNSIFDNNVCPQFIRLTTESGITSSESSINLNFYHLFQPSLIASSMMHECFNFFGSILKVGHYNSVATILPKNSQSDISLWNHDALMVYLNEICGIYLYFNEDHSIEYKENEESRELYLALSDNVFRHLAIDLTTWHLAYKQNSELFLYWHLGSILQDTSNYVALNEIDNRVFIQVSCRFLLLAYFIEGLVDSKNSDEEIKFKKFEITELKKSLKSIFSSDETESEFEEHFDNYSKICERFVKGLLDLKGDAGSYNEKLKKIASTNPNVTESQEDENAVLGEGVFRISSDNSFRLLKMSANSNKPKTRAEEIYYANVSKFEFLDGLVEFKDFICHLLQKINSKDDESFQTINDLFYTHLVDVYNKRIGDSSISFDSSYDLKISGESKDGAKPIIGKADLKFNPMGGMFAYTQEMRKFLLQKKSNFYHELWDLNQKLKIEEFNENYKKKK